MYLRKKSLLSKLFYLEGVSPKEGLQQKCQDRTKHWTMDCIINRLLYGIWLEFIAKNTMGEIASVHNIVTCGHKIGKKEMLFFMTFVKIWNNTSLEKSVYSLNASISVFPSYKKHQRWQTYIQEWGYLVYSLEGFDAGFRTGVLWRLLVPLWRLHLLQDQFQTPWGCGFLLEACGWHNGPVRPNSNSAEFRASVVVVLKLIWL